MNENRPKSPDQDAPQTEALNPASRGIDGKSAAEIAALMLEEEQKTLLALGVALPEIARASEAAAWAIKRGGAVYYAGAGTSGRLGVLDAAEVYPTFGRTCFKAAIAGGPDAITQAVEGAEDDLEAGRAAASALSANDMAIGITASGRTPFVMGFLQGASERGAACWLLACAPVKPGIRLDGIISILTGAEILAGSTRLKAGTATKIALNMISTAAMIATGGVYDGLMVDVVPSNEKLIARAEGIVMAVSGCTRQRAREALNLAGMRPKAAALIAAGGLSPEEALAALEASGGFLRRALGALGGRDPDTTGGR